MPDQKGRNRRSDFRQDDMLRMKEVVLSKDQFELELNRASPVSDKSSLQKRLAGNDAAVNPEVSKALELLDAKLNYVIEMNMLQQQSNQIEMEERLVNISATGMRFTTSEPCRKGDHLKITMSLPVSSPPIMLELLARVVYINEKNGRVQLGASFIFRSGKEEEALVGYIFKRQREMLRMKGRG